MSRNIYEMMELLTGPRNPSQETLEASLRELKDDAVVKGLLDFNFNPRFVGFDLALGAPFYDTNKLQPYGFAETQLSTQFRRLYIFFNGYVELNRDGKERRFIQLLEGLHWREAELLIAIKDRKLQELFPKIDRYLIRKVFPDMLPALTEEDDIWAAGIGGPNSDENNPQWKLYNKAEVLHLSRHRRMIFQDHAHALAMGLDHLLPGYIAPILPPTYYDPELFLEFTVEKTVFGNTISTVYHELIETLDVAKIEDMGRHGSALTFTDLVKATELGVAKADIRNKEPVKKPVKKKAPTKKRVVAKKVVAPVEVI
jgi:hypothetical protein